MKTKGDMYERILKLNEIGVRVTLKHSIYIHGVSFEFTTFSAKDQSVSGESSQFRIFFYLNERYDDMCDRIDRFLEQRQKFLDQYATDDFKTLLDYKNLSEYLKNKDNSDEDD